MKYSITRKLNLKRFFPEMQYETVDFTILEADSPKEAQQELESWIKSYLQDKTKKEFLTEESGVAFQKILATDNKKVINDPNL